MFRFTITILVLFSLFTADIAHAKARKGIPAQRGGGGTRYSAMY